MGKKNKKQRIKIAPPTKRVGHHSWRGKRQTIMDNRARKSKTRADQKKGWQKDQKDQNGG